MPHSPVCLPYLHMRMWVAFWQGPRLTQGLHASRCAPTTPQNWQNAEVGNPVAKQLMKEVEGEVAAAGGANKAPVALSNLYHTRDMFFKPSIWILGGDGWVSRASCLSATGLVCALPALLCSPLAHASAQTAKALLSVRVAQPLRAPPCA